MMQAKNDKNTVSDLLMANVEALAMGESGSGHKHETKEEKTIEVMHPPLHASQTPCA